MNIASTTDGTTTINPTALKMSMSAGSLTLKEFSFAPTAATYTANGNGVLYFALPSAADVAAGLSTTTDALSVVTITYTATVGGNTYTATKTGYTFAAGKYYAGTLTMKQLTIVTWDNTNVFTDTNQNKKVDKWSTGPFTFEDVSISFTGSGANSSFTPYGGMGETTLKVFESTGGQFTFTAPSGKQFTKIEITDNNFANFTDYGDWTKNGLKQAVWSGTPSNTVTLGRGSGYSNNYQFGDLKSIVFTLQ
jgi:hypothetical protein